jgi:hypothetical protein
MFGRTIEIVSNWAVPLNGSYRCDADVLSIEGLRVMGRIDFRFLEASGLLANLEPRREAILASDEKLRSLKISTCYQEYRGWQLGIRCSALFFDPCA